MLIFVWLIDVSQTIKNNRPGLLWRATLWILVYVIGIPLGIFSTVGGTIMQLAGVYRNCICIAGLKYVAPVFRSSGIVDLTTDTHEHRDSWWFWWWAGCAALFFFSVVLLVASFHKMWMKEKCEKIIKFLADQEAEMETAAQHAGGIEDRDLESENYEDVRDRQPLLRAPERMSTVPVDVPY